MCGIIVQVVLVCLVRSFLYYNTDKVIFYRKKIAITKIGIICDIVVVLSDVFSCILVVSRHLVVAVVGNIVVGYV